MVDVQNDFNLEDNAVEKFISAITPQFAKDFGGILSDTIKGWKCKNQIITLQTKNIL